MAVRPPSVDGAVAGVRRGSGAGGAIALDAIDLVNIVDAVEIPIVVVGHDFTIAGFNQAATDVLGLTAAEASRTLGEIPVLAGTPEVERHCLEAIADGTISRVDLRDGERWFVVRVAPYANGNEGVGAVLTFTNVTAFRASMDQAIYERESTKVILNAVADPLVVLSADQRIQSGNRAFYTMFGVSRDGTQGAPFRQIAGGAFDRIDLHVQLADMLVGTQGFRPVEVDDVATSRGPRTLVLDAHPLSFPGLAEHRVLVTLQDITVRKQAEAAKDQRSEEELRRSEAFLAEGQRLSLTGSFSWKVATDEITWSAELYRIFELEDGLPVSLDLIRSRVHPDDLSMIEKLQQIGPDGPDDVEWQYRLLMPDQSIKHLHAVGHAIRNQGGRLEWISAVQDVTARRLSEEALAKARSELARVARATSLGMLAASIAHEVNQPLAGIITNAGTCLRMLDAEPPNVAGARETVRRTIRDGNRAADVITRVRALFSRDEFALESVDLNEVTREIIALSLSDLQRNQVVVATDLADELPPIAADRIQIQQVILNLLRNASDAMADVHGRSRQLVVRTQRDNADHVCLSVRDVGVGVEPESMNKLLDAFYTTKPDGMGIGLSVSSSIIDRHGGRLWATPNEGPGATFSFSIPIRTDRDLGGTPR
jgi:signal transduction histidine kinase